MYQDFFSLREQPFNLTPDPRFFFQSPQHEAALSHLRYGINERRGFIEITGEVGTGKTILCRALLNELDATVSTALILNSYLSEIELLQAILHDFGLPCEGASRQAYIDTLNHFLLQEYAAGRNAVVIIDETQNMDPAVLEQLRMLSNLETESGKLVQVVLVGQPELRDKLAMPQMRQLTQRIAVRYHIRSLTAAETKHYVLHRLSVAGAANSVHFTARAWSVIHRHCGGLPRRINLLCDRILMTAYVRETRRITARIVRLSVNDLTGAWGPAPRNRASVVYARLSLGLLAGIGVLSLASWIVAIPAVQDYIRHVIPHRVSALTQVPPESERVPAPAPMAIPAPVALPTPPPVPPQPVSQLHQPSPTAVVLLQRLWQMKTHTEQLFAFQDTTPIADRDTLLSQEAQAVGLDVMAVHVGPAQLRRFTRPCLLEIVPNAPLAPPTFWVLAKVFPDHALLYREPDGLTKVALPDLYTAWSGKLYLTLETATQRAPILRPGTRGARVHALQQVLHDLGYHPGPPSNYFGLQTAQAVKAFQQANQLTVDGHVGPQTLMMLLHLDTRILADTT